MSLSFLKSMPKVELHAHLSGSLSVNTIQKLLLMHQKLFPEEPVPEELRPFLLKAVETFDEAFNFFAAVQFILDNQEAVEVAVDDVLKEFAEDGVKYLEIRTTPRHVKGKMSKVEQLESVVKSMRKSKDLIEAKLLLSIDRGRSLLDAEETLELCLSMAKTYPDQVVGIDFSGDARVNDALDFLPVLKSARAAGLKVAVHIAEVPNFKETESYLGNLKPDRIGHGTSIHPEMSGGHEKLWNLLLQNKIPVEVCLSSNVLCGSVPRYADHHVKFLLHADHPFIVCTDDKGAFGCTLTGEYELLQNTFHLTDDQVFRLSYRSIDFCFATETEKKALRYVWNSWKEKHAK